MALYEPQPLAIPEHVIATVARLCQAIAHDEQIYRRYLSLAHRLQGTTHGLLSDIVEAMREE